MKANKYFYSLLILLALTFSSCEKDIKIKELPYEDQLTVECILIPGEVPKLYLGKSVAFFDSKVSPSSLSVNGATISITGSSIDYLVEDSIFDKFQCRYIPFYKGSIPSVIGQPYTLNVSYNGKTYTATTTISQPKVTISSTSYTPTFHDLYGEHEGVIVDFTDIASSENYYRYQMNRLIDSTVYGASNLGLIHSTCTDGSKFFISEYGRSIYPDRGLDGKSMEFVIEPAFLHQQDDTAYILVQSLDKASGEFYESLDKQKLALLNPFIEPVFIKSNIVGGLGIFGSMVVSDSTLFIYPE